MNMCMCVNLSVLVLVNFINMFESFLVGDFSTGKYLLFAHMMTICDVTKWVLNNEYNFFYYLCF